MKRKKNFIIHYLPVFGCFATGIIYSAIGIIAILSFLKLKDGGADENSFLAFLNEYVVGKVIVWIIMAGSISYIAWRIYESIKDPYGYGNKISGKAKRIGIALSTIADILIVYAAFNFLFEKGNLNDNEQLGVQRQMVQDVLQKNNGYLLIVGIGLVVAFTAIIQLLYGITKGYRERLEIEELKPALRKPVHFLGITGYFSRGIILGITAFFYIKAGILNDAQMVVNTDKAFDFIGDHIGHVYFILVAAGTFFYGLFMFALGISYDTDKD